MTVKAQIMYESEDGQLHTTRLAAMKHDSAWKSMTGLKAVFLKVKPSYNDTLHVDINNKPELALALRDACNRALDSHRRYGKLRKPA